MAATTTHDYFGLIQLDDDDKLISLLGDSVQIALTTASNMTNLLDGLNQVGAAADLKIYVGNELIADDHDTTPDDTTPESKLSDYLTVVEIDNGSNKIMTKADAPTPFVVQMELRHGGSALTGTMTSIRLVVPHLNPTIGNADGAPTAFETWSPTMNVLAREKYAIAAPAGTAKNTVKVADNTAVYNIGFIGANLAAAAKMGLANFPRLYAYIGSDGTVSETDEVSFDAEEGQYVPFCEGALHYEERINKTEMTTHTFGASLRNKFIPFVHVGGYHGFHLVPEINSQADNIMAALVVDPVQANINVLTKESGIATVYTHNDFTIHMISDLVSFDSLADFASGGNGHSSQDVNMSDVKTTYPAVIEFTGNDSLDAGFKDINLPEQTFTMDTPSLAITDIRDGAAVLDFSASVAANDFISAATPEDGDQRKTAPGEIEFQRTSNVFTHNAEFDVTFSMAWNTDTNQFLNSAIANNIPDVSDTVNCMYQDFLQGMHAAATYRQSAQGSEIEITNFGRAVGSYSAETDQHVDFGDVTDGSFKLAGDETTTYRVGDTVMTHDGTTQTAATTIASISFSDDDNKTTISTVDPITPVSSQTYILQDVVAEVDIVSPIKFGDESEFELLAKQKVTNASNTLVKDSLTLTNIAQVVDTDDQPKTGEYILTFANVPTTFNISNQLLELPIDAIQPDYRDLDLFARGVQIITAKTGTTLTVKTLARHAAEEVVFVASTPSSLHPKNVLIPGSYDNVQVEIADISNVKTFEHGSSNAMYVRGDGNGGPNAEGDYKLESIADDDSDHKKSFRVRYVNPTGTFPSNGANQLGLQLFARRVITNKYGIQNTNVLLPFPTSFRYTADPNNANASDDVIETVSLSADSVARQGLHLNLQGADPLIAGASDSYVGDTGYIETDLLIKGYFNGSYTVSQVRRNDTEALHTEVTAEADTAAGATTLNVTVPSGVTIATDKTYKLAISDAQQAQSNPQFGTNTTATFSSGATASSGTFTLSSALVGKIDENTAITYYEVDNHGTTNAVETVAVATDRQVKLVYDEDGGKRSARVWIKQSATNEWDDDDTVTFKINNSGSGSDIGTFTIFKTTSRPTIALSRTAVNVDNDDHLEYFKVAYQINNLDVTHAPLLGTLKVEEYRDNAFENLSDVVISAITGSTLTGKETGTLIAPPDNSNSNVVYQIRPKQFVSTAFKKSSGYDFYSIGNGVSYPTQQVTRTLANAFVADSASTNIGANYPTSPQYTAGQTDFTLNTTGMVTAGAGNSREVDVTFNDSDDREIEDYSGLFSLSNITDGGGHKTVTIGTLTTDHDGTKIVVTIVNQDAVTSLSSHLYTNNAFVAPQQALLLTGSTSEGVTHSNVQVLTRTITLSVKAQASLAFNNSALALNWRHADYGTQLTNKYVAYALTEHGQEASLGLATATNVSDTYSATLVEDDKLVALADPSAAKDVTLTLTHTLTNNIDAHYGVAISDAVKIKTSTKTVHFLDDVVRTDTSTTQFGYDTTSKNLYVVADERLITTSVHELVSENMPVDTKSYSVLPSVSASMANGTSMSIAASHGSSAAENGSITIVTSFAANADTVCVDYDTKTVSRDATVTASYAYDAYLDAQNETLATSPVELSWTVKTMVVNPNRATENLRQFYATTHYANSVNNKSVDLERGDTNGSDLDSSIALLNQESLTLSYSLDSLSTVVGVTNLVSLTATTRAMSIKADDGISTFELEPAVAAPSPSKSWIKMHTAALDTTHVLVQSYHYGGGLQFHDSNPNITATDGTTALVLLSADGTTYQNTSADSNKNLSTTGNAVTISNTPLIYEFYTRVRPTVSGVMNDDNITASISVEGVSGTVDGVWRSVPEATRDGASFGGKRFDGNFNEDNPHSNVNNHGWSIGRSTWVEFVRGTTLEQKTRTITGGNTEILYRKDTFQWKLEFDDNGTSTPTDFSSSANDMNEVSTLALLNLPSIASPRNIHASYKIGLTDSSDRSTNHTVQYQQVATSLFRVPSSDSITIEPQFSTSRWNQSGGAFTREVITDLNRSPVQYQGNDIDIGNGVILTESTSGDKLQITDITLQYVGDIDFQPAANQITTFKLKIDAAYTIGDDTYNVAAIETDIARVVDQDTSAQGTNPTMRIVGNEYHNLFDTLGGGEQPLVTTFAEDASTSLRSVQHHRGGCATIQKANSIPEQTFDPLTVASVTNTDAEKSITFTAPPDPTMIGELKLESATNPATTVTTDSNTALDGNTLTGIVSLDNVAADDVLTFKKNEQFLNVTRPFYDDDFNISDAYNMTNVDVYKWSSATSSTITAVEAVSATDGRPKITLETDDGTPPSFDNDTEYLIVADADFNDAEADARGQHHHLSGIYVYTTADGMIRKDFEEYTGNHTSVNALSTFPAGGIAVKYKKMGDLEKAGNTCFKSPNFRLDRPTIIAGLDAGGDAFHKEAEAEYVFVAQIWDGFVWGFRMNQTSENVFKSDRDIAIDDIMDIEARRLQSSATDSAYEHYFRPAKLSSDAALQSKVTAATTQANILIYQDETITESEAYTWNDRALLSINAFF